MEPPPPYSESQAVSFANLQELDYEGCTCKRELLVTIRNTPNQLRPVALHYWNITETGVCSEQHLLIPGNLSQRSLQLIDHFQDLGTITLPVDATSHSTTIHRYLTASISGIDKQFLRGTEFESLVPTLLTHLRHQVVSQPSEVIHVASIPVYTNSTDKLFDGGPAVVWKWVKLSSACLPGSGFWEPELEQSLHSGEWQAGTALSILMKGVSDERKDELRRKRVLRGA